MERDEVRLVALVNLLIDSFYPNPDGAGTAGQWRLWINEAIKDGPFPHPWGGSPLPDPWKRHMAAFASGDQSWQDDHRGASDWTTAFAELAAVAGQQVDDHAYPFGRRASRPNWALAALLSHLASLNPPPLPPVDSGIGFARALANVALRHARAAGGAEGANLLLRFSEDWCGNVVRNPTIPAPGDPDEPRPPRPEESLVLGASLVRAASLSDDDPALKKGVEEAGRRVFDHGLAGLA